MTDSRDDYLSERIAGLRTEMLAAMAAMHEDVREIKLQVIATNGRVSKLEMWRSYLLGVAGAIAVGFTLFKTLVVK